MTLVLCILSAVAGVLVGLRVGAGWRASLTEQVRGLSERHDAWNLQAKATDLAEVGPVTPAKGTVELYDQDADPLAFAASVGREHAAARPPRMTGERDTDAQDRELSEVYGIKRTYSLDEVIEEHGFTQAEIDAADDGPDYAGWAQGISHDPTVRHVGQACGWNFDDETVCGDPAEGWSQWPDGEVVWLCATHFQWVRPSEDDTGPRSVPGPRVSD